MFHNPKSFTPLPAFHNINFPLIKMASKTFNNTLEIKPKYK